MRKRRKALEIKKEILRVLRKNGELSLRELDIKVRTNSQTIRDQVEELVYFEKVILKSHSKSDINGRPYKTVRLA